MSGNADEQENELALGALAWAHDPQCRCAKCQEYRAPTTWGILEVTLPWRAACGNKRCPRASNHALPCTGSRA